MAGSLSRIEIGGAWQREGKKSGNSYLSLRLDDPSFTAPVYANLIAAGQYRSELSFMSSTSFGSSASFPSRITICF